LAFREGLEAALITAMVLAYLRRTKRSALSRYIWYGIYVVVAASLIFGVSIWLFYGGLAESAKAVFEGVAALFAVSVLSSMIYWMAAKGRELRTEIERRVEAIATRGATVPLIAFAFVVVFREGLETVLFLTPFFLEDVTGTLVGASLAIVASSAFAYAIFVVGMKIDMRKFFYLTSLLLVLLAGGLAGYGVHELIEYTEEMGIELGWIGEPAYVLDIPKGNVLHHKGVVGSIFAVMFGYAVEAEWARMIAHLSYSVVTLPLVIRIYRKENLRV